MFKTEEIVQPFWGHFPKGAGGRDPLAVQNSSVVIYTSMIEGITNVTLRVRYNGFYCWLLNLISKKLFKVNAKLVDSKDDQIKYLRRAELLLAYIMSTVPKFKAVTGVSGTLYSQKHSLKEGVCDLAKGADVENGLANTYWRNRKGIFGQYYVGVLIQLGLVCSPNANRHTYRTTSEGDKLADAYNGNIPQEKAELFWSSIYNGEIGYERLCSLKEFALHEIPLGTELDAYRNIFRGRDSINYLNNPTQYRFQSMKLLFDYINEEGASIRSCVGDFLKYNFEIVIAANLQVDAVQLAWFLYEFNELAHTAYESFHFGLLYMVVEDSLSLDNVLNEIKLGIQELSQKNGIYCLTDFLEKDNSSIHQVYEQMFGRKVQREGIQRMFDATHLLIKLQTVLSKHYQLLHNFAFCSGFSFNRRGYAPDLVDSLVDGKEKMAIASFVEEVIIRAINDHTYSSYQKSLIDGGLVHNYIIEEDSIRRLRKTNPIRTSPRLQNVLYYMEDLKWISRKGDKYIVEGGFDV